MDIDYGFGRTIEGPFEQAIEEVTAALGAQGFGVLFRLDIHHIMKKKLDVEMPGYTILGACNPGIAHEAIQAESNIGLLLPCNVLVREVSGGAGVSMADPKAMGAFTQNAQLDGPMDQADALLRAALAQV
ncbi:MAG: DUF302 domain-containing protein [Myxococcota bacterium]